MIDIDHAEKNAPPKKLISAGQRLVGAISAKALDVKDVWLYPSQKVKHYHLIVRLNSNGYFEGSTWRAMWELYLRSDVYRSCQGMARSFTGVGAPSLLITDTLYANFYRTTDHTCECPSKHTLDVMENCPIAKILRGQWRAFSHFGAPDPRGVKWNYGKVSL